jgi:hypothetical protein
VTPDSTDKTEAWPPQRLDDSPTLFPMESDEFLEQSGLPRERLRDWAAAGWLSFDLDAMPRFEECHLAEVKVVRDVLDSGLQAEAAQAILRALPKPCQFDPRCLCYNFHTHAWHSLPRRSEEQTESEVEERIRDELMVEFGNSWDDHIEALVTEGDCSTLADIQSQILEAIKRAENANGETERD